MIVQPGYKGLAAFCEAIGEPLLGHEQRIARAYFGPAREVVAILPRGNLKTTLAAKIGLPKHVALTAATYLSHPPDNVLRELLAIAR